MAPLACEALSSSSFCAAWPGQSLSEAVDAETVGQIRRAVRKTLLPFAAGIDTQRLSSLMRRPCMQRMCLRVQLVRGELYVVAPPDLSPCRKGVSAAAALDCIDTPPNTQGSWRDHEMCQREKRVEQSPMCREEWRRKQPGVTVPDWWYAPSYPHVTDWHFASGLNFSDCKSTGEPIPGDHNYVFSRLRMGGMLRLLWSAYRRCLLLLLCRLFSRASFS